jgi:hypothetical protein
MNDLNWVKSSYSTATSGNCVEVAALPDGGRAVRDSKNPDGPVLLLTADQWRRLGKGVLQLKEWEKPPENKSGGPSSRWPAPGRSLYVRRLDDFAGPSAAA